MNTKLVISCLIFLFSIKCLRQSNPQLAVESDYPKQIGIVQNNKTNLFGILDSNLQITVPFEYNYIMSDKVSDFMIAVKGGKWGVINRKNKIIYDFVYDRLDLYESYMIATKGKDEARKCQVTHIQSGKQIIPFTKEYTFITYETNFENKTNYFKARNFANHSTDYYNLDGTMINNFQYDDINIWGEYYISSLQGKQGILNKEGMEILKPSYDHVEWIDDDMACVYENRQANIIDLKTKKIINATYNSVRRREEDNGYMIVSKKVEGITLYGIINQHFVEIFPLCKCAIEYSIKNKYFIVEDKISTSVKNYTVNDLNKIK